jgi:hypothetical protein
METSEIAARATSGERTALDYVLGPLTSAIAKGMRERWALMFALWTPVQWEDGGQVPQTAGRPLVGSRAEVAGECLPWNLGRITPAAAGQAPASARAQVDLPLPDAPMTARLSPARTVRLMPCNTGQPPWATTRRPSTRSSPTDIKRVRRLALAEEHLVRALQGDRVERGGKFGTLAWREIRKELDEAEPHLRCR